MLLKCDLVFLSVAIQLDEAKFGEKCLEASSYQNISYVKLGPSIKSIFTVRFLGTKLPVVFVSYRMNEVLCFSEMLLK